MQLNGFRFLGIRFFRSGYKNIFLLTVLVMIVGLIIDLYSTPTTRKALTIDIITILLWGISIIIFYAKSSRYKLSFAIALYALFLNILLTFSVSYEEEKILTVFFRNTVFISFIVTLSAYLINKYHAFIFTAIYIIFLYGFLLKFNDPVLISNTNTLVFAMLSYSGIIFYFVGIQEKTFKALEKINKQVNIQNEELVHQSEEITAQRDILESQKVLIENHNTEIISGIRFAKSIQESVLPNETHLSKYFKQYFIINKPKALISGDFFWMKEWKGKLYIAVVDCTGHGVPGSLVSMLANMYLGRSFIEIENPNPAKIINYISNAIAREVSVIETFHSRIGMDMALVAIDFQNMVLEYSGAFSPLYIIRRDNLIQLEATKSMIGASLNDVRELTTEFSNQSITILKKDKLYLFTDGAVDQFGGDLQKKFGYKRFRNALIDTNHNSLFIQKDLFMKKWRDWKRDQLQVDDMLLIGVEI